MSSHAHALIIKSLSLKAMSIVAPLFVVFLVSFYLAKRPLRLLYARSVVLSVHAQALSTSNSGGEDVDTEQQHTERADNDTNDDESLCSVRVMAYDCIAYKAATELPITRAATAAAAAAIVARTNAVANAITESPGANEEQGTSSGCQNSSQLVGSDSSKGDNFETV